jgi:hypothetical protein
MLQMPNTCPNDTQIIGLTATLKIAIRSCRIKNVEKLNDMICIMKMKGKFALPEQHISYMIVAQCITAFRTYRPITTNYVFVNS